MPLLRLQRLQKNPQVLRHCVRLIYYDPREEEDCRSVQSCGNGLSSMGNGIPQQTSLEGQLKPLNTESRIQMHPQNSSFKIWKDANILLHGLARKYLNRISGRLYKEREHKFLSIPAEGNLNSFP